MAIFWLVCIVVIHLVLISPELLELLLCYSRCECEVSEDIHEFDQHLGSYFHWIFPCPPSAVREIGENLALH
jgi:hypothetical protein